MNLKSELDFTGLSCPMPILKAKQAFKHYQAGDCIRIVASDPTTRDDFVTFAERTSHRLLGMYQIEQKYYYIFQISDHANSL